MNFSVVIPNYNGKKILEKCILSIIEACEKYGSSEIIIVDDASSDDSVEFIKENYPKIKIFKNKKNRGFSYSANLGVKRASNEIVFLLNSDIKVEKDFADSIIPLFNDDSVFAVQSKVFSFDGNSVEVGRSYIEIDRGYVDIKQDISSDNVSSSFFAGGGMSAFRKNYYLLLGGMSDLYYPFYWEDVHLSYKAWKNGYKILYQPNSIIYHMGSATIDKISKNKFKDIMIYAHRIVFFLSSFDILLVSYLFIIQILRLANSLINGNKVIRKGTLISIKKISKIYKYRIFYRNRFELTDNEIFKMTGI